MYLLLIVLLNFLFTAAEQNADLGYCDIEANTCDGPQNVDAEKFIFYDVNPPEGFNLRRDVYMRFAIMLAEARRSGKKQNWSLVLPPWHRLYHWKSLDSRHNPVPWAHFFDIQSLKTYAPIVELQEIFSKTHSKTLLLDRLYILQNYADAFEGGTFREKWDVIPDCDYDGDYWGYNNVTVKEIICVRFQGKISKLWELVSLHPTDKKIMFSHGEIPLHDNYGTKSYWNCRRSMKFNKQLIETANNFIRNNLECDTTKCTTYMSVHWRRQDFARSRSNYVPTISGTAQQIDRSVKKYSPTIRKIFIASDATLKEMEQLENELKSLGYNVNFYLPTRTELETYHDGGIAIIDQIICSHSAYFIGTHESTFSFRIQEEREILGFDSSTTFNRLCPDHGVCEKPSKWTIVN